MKGDVGWPDLHLRKKKTNVRRVGYLLLFLFGNPTGFSLAVGTGLVLIAVLVHGWAAGYLARAGYSSRETLLTVRGPYRHNRNPYYVSHLVMDFGFFTAAGLFFLYPFYFPFIFLIYWIWVDNEEDFLEEEFGEAYEQMKNQVPRWGIRLTPAPSRGHEENFTWSDYFVNNEFKRTLCHLFLIGLLWDFYYLENPFLWMGISARMTLLSFYVLWIVYRDAYLDEPDTTDQGFLFTGISVWLWSLTTFLLFSGVTDLTLPLYVRVIGVVLLAVPVGYLILPLHRKFSNFYKGHFCNPMSYLFDLLIGAGLVSGSYLILWWTMTFLLVLWAVNAEQGKWLQTQIIVPYIMRRESSCSGTT